MWSASEPRLGLFMWHKILVVGSLAHLVYIWPSVIRRIPVALGRYPLNQKLRLARPLLAVQCK